MRVAGNLERFRVYSCLKPGTGVKVYFIDNDRFYARKGIYTVPETGKAFPDEDERTIFFNRAVIAAIKALDLHPDVIHCNDFHSGLIPALSEPRGVRTIRISPARRRCSASTISPIRASSARSSCRRRASSRSLFAPMSPFEFWGRVNVMKVAISYADIISTVSRTYAEEITSTEEYGCGLEGVLRSRKSGSRRNPERHRHGRVGSGEGCAHPVPVHARRTLAGKGTESRRSCSSAFALPQTDAGPRDRNGFAARRSEGIRYPRARPSSRLWRSASRLVILGTGQEKYHELYWGFAKKYPKQFGLKLEFNDRLAHLIEAGSDFFLMPSRYEPCGLNQMYSLRYGTIPIVRATGGLLDTISEIDGGGASPETDSSSGSIQPPRSSTPCARAVDFYRDKTALRKVRKRIMKEDHSWRRSAEEYCAMYERARSLVGMGLTK